MHTRQSWRISGLVTVCLLAFSRAAAQTSPDSEKIERLERQAELLQAQLTALQDEIAHIKKNAAKVEAVQPGSAVTPGGSPANSHTPEALPQPAGINVTLSGYVEAATVFRTHNQVNDMLTVFDGIPYPSSPLYNEHEFHNSARQTQLSVLAEDNIDASQKLAAYFEIDFLGVGTSSTYVYTNDWPPRLRDAYLTYDNDKWGFHLLAGQEWSMIVPEKVGITPRQENIPLTINANYLVGFDFSRSSQLRVVKDFDKKFWLGASLETPATLNDPGIPQTVNGLVVNAVNTGTGGFLNGVMVTPSKVPDIFEKVAWDPGWGHYELLTLQRVFTDNTLCATAAPTGCVPGTASRKTSVGAGVGGSVLLPVIPKYLQAMGGWSYGRGMGRYGAGNLPDATIAADGSLSPITAFHGWAGIEVDRKGLQLYAYSGFEQERANYFGAFGYGNPAFDNSGCTTPTAASFVTGTSAACVANTRRLTDIKAGFWQDIYKGPVGRFVAGVEFDHIKREAFSGIGGAPSTDNNIVYTSLRYYFDTSLTKDHRPTGKQ